MKRIVTVLSALAAFILVLTTAAAAETTLKVGLILPLSGPHAAFGAVEKNAALLALDDVNAQSVDGRKIELIVEDDASNPARALEAVDS